MGLFSPSEAMSRARFSTPYLLGKTFWSLNLIGPQNKCKISISQLEFWKHYFSKGISISLETAYAPSYITILYIYLVISLCTLDVNTIHIKTCTDLYRLC